MKIEEMLDMVEEFEEMSAEQCKGILMGFFLGLNFTDGIKDGINEAFDKAELKKSDLRHQKYKGIRLEFQKRDDAQDTMIELKEMLESSDKGYVSVRDLYSLAEMPTNPEMNKWVWYDLEDSTIERSGDNYVLKMPPAQRYVSDGFDHMTFVFDSLRGASAALSAIKRFMRVESRDGFVSVKDAMSIADQNLYMTCNDQIASSLYGWYDLEDTFVSYDHRYCGLGSRYIIKMPPAMEIDPIPRSKQSS